MRLSVVGHIVGVYGGAQQKLFPPAYLGIAGMRAYAIYMRNMQSRIFRIQDGVEVVDNGSTISIHYIAMHDAFTIVLEHLIRLNCSQQC